MCDPDGFIKFAGMILSSKGLSPDPDKMSAIRDFPIPYCWGLSPAHLFFQREIRVPMFYTLPCDKDEHGAGLQRHYDRGGRER